MHGAATAAGPPGTGKTVTSASIVYQLVKSGTGQVRRLPASPAAICNAHHQLLDRSPCLVLNIWKHSPDRRKVANLGVVIVQHRFRTPHKIYACALFNTQLQIVARCWWRRRPMWRWTS